jgi:peptide/nickel transport system substrate-binding protein
MKRVFTILVLLLAATSILVAQAKIKNPDTLIMAANGDVDSLDPAKAYDNVSWSMISVIYDRLIDFDKANLGKFLPTLATEVPTVANGGISKDGLTYTFKIRQGVKFSNGYPLTAEDVAYSFKRSMVTDTDA